MLPAMSLSLIPTIQFSETGKSDYLKTGIKGSHLAEMVKSKIPIPPGFVVSADAYTYFLDISKVREKIHDIISTLNVSEPKELKQASELIQDMILKSTIPPVIDAAIAKSYGKLSGLMGAFVAVRSSIAYDDMSDDSFAGISSTFLNIKGARDVMLAVKACWASLFEPEALYYMHEKEINPMKVGMAVVVQKMVQAEVSGVLFTVDPVNHNNTRVILEGVLGLGEIIDTGSVTPDHYELDKSSYKIDVKKVFPQMEMVIRSTKHKENEEQIKKVTVSAKWQRAQKLDDKKIVELAKIGMMLEGLFGAPQDIEWVLENGKPYILQSRSLLEAPDAVKNNLEKTISQFFDKPEEVKQVAEQLSETRTEIPAETPIEVVTPAPQVHAEPIVQEQVVAPSYIQAQPEIILSGSPASEGEVAGIVRIIRKDDDFMKLNSGDILVIEQIRPDYILWMRKAGGIITNVGGMASHGAVLSREFKIPCIVGTENATDLLRDGQRIIVNGTNGRVYTYNQGGNEIPEPVAPSMPVPASLLIEPEADQPELLPVVEAPAEIQAMPEPEMPAKIIIPPLPGTPAPEMMDSGMQAIPEEMEEVRVEDKTKTLPYHQTIKTATKIFINLSDKHEASSAAQRDSDGIGFVDGSYIINSVIHNHPESFLENENIESYISAGAALLETLCKEFSPRPVIYRPSNLVSSSFDFDAAPYEEKEINPLLGYNGARRYIQTPSLFTMEIEIIKTVRNKLGYKNLSILLPMIRDAHDLREIKKMITSNDLKRSSTFKIYLPIESPASVFLINELIAIGIDGIFIMANTLSEYISAVDTNNYRYKHFPIFNEAFMMSAEVIIKTAHKNRIHAGVILQGKEYEDSALKDLIGWGATYISVDTYYLDKTKAVISDIEKALILSRRH